MVILSPRRVYEFIKLINDRGGEQGDPHKCT